VRVHPRDGTDRGVEITLYGTRPLSGNHEWDHAVGAVPITDDPSPLLQPLRLWRSRIAAGPEVVEPLFYGRVVERLIPREACVGRRVWRLAGATTATTSAAVLHTGL
jgi:hypothetical protein